MKYFAFENLVYSWTTTDAYHADSNLCPLGTESDDRFALHPEQHIYREPRTIHQRWSITRQLQRPDGVLKRVYLINGQFPGPTIEARAGDEIEITVINRVENDDDDGVVIHWHGMLMKGFNEMDGVVGVTQCRVATGETFTYRFHIHRKQHGTFWYHAHSAVKRADGLYGALIVHKPVEGRIAHSDMALYEYDGEKLLLIGDWYHMPAEKVLAEYKDFRSFAYEPVPDSLLINGMGSYNCSNARPGRPVACIKTDRLPLQVFGNKAVRLRVVNVGASSGYSFQVENAALQLLAVDGGGAVSNATPQTSTLGVLYPGERMDVLLLPQKTITDRSAPSTVDLKIILDPELMQLMNPALTRAQSFALEWVHCAHGRHDRNDIRDTVDMYDLNDAQGPVLARNSPVRKKPAEIALLYTSLAINSFKNDEPWGELNHSSWVWKDANTAPLLATHRTAWVNGTEQANPLRTFNVPQFAAGQDRWLDLVINNVDDKGHPFHLHGYQFYVLGSRQDELGRSYNPFEAAVNHEDKLINIDTPLIKDTVYIKPRGYVILRFRLDNPGLWLMHCHVLWHQAVGMGTVLQIGRIARETARKAEQSCRWKGNHK
ncbi:uncharacterized protein UV8b_03311 [Ustilaginoidea virens]|uniref:Uncharacterized protein n=1 Tax=Ustilaginoidea virens TaxID=1159556 RepID=A0A8E5HP45_USTVR|nr:uncharacterized protein UV8b_03311 [Ustilaginoidea virens]QUC19070.1 hypothetical protein UV8b_03311 [Ustilaginoidea virens]